MKTTTKKMFLGAVLGGVIAQFAVLACGKVAATLDANAAVDTLANADGAATTTAFAGFSYHTDGFVKKSGWNPVVVDVLDYNTFTSSSYDVRTGTFTAPLSGYYRFSAHGYSPTATPSSDTRIAAGFGVNGTIVAIGGGQLSGNDSPLPSFAHIIHLSTGDKVSVAAYTTIDIVFGASGLDVNSSYYFQGEYLGQ